MPNRARYSVGASRFSLPSNLSPPGPAIASPGRGGGPVEVSSLSLSLSPRNEEPGGVWEGLTLTHPLTGDEKNLVGGWVVGVKSAEGGGGMVIICVSPHREREESGEF